MLMTKKQPYIANITLKLFWSSILYFKKSNKELTGKKKMHYGVQPYEHKNTQNFFQKSGKEENDDSFYSSYQALFDFWLLSYIFNQKSLKIFITTRGKKMVRIW